MNLERLYISLGRECEEGLAQSLRIESKRKSDESIIERKTSAKALGFPIPLAF
jgi:hypothetical protein